MYTRRKELDAALLHVLQQPVQKLYYAYTANFHIDFRNTKKESHWISSLSTYVIEEILYAITTSLTASPSCSAPYWPGKSPVRH